MSEYPPDIRSEVKILEGDIFFISDERGNVREIGPYGLFHKDTRFLSRYWLEINRYSPWVLTPRELHHFSAAFFLSNPPMDGIPENTLSIVRHRFVGRGAVYEEITIHNYNPEPVSLELTLDFDSDFADLFEVKGERIEKRGELTREIDEEAPALRYTYRRESFLRRTVIDFFTEKPRLGVGGATFDVAIAAKSFWRTCLEIAMETETERPLHFYSCSSFARSEAEVHRSLEQWRWRIPQLASDCDALNHIYRQSSIDLTSLRLRNGVNGESSLLAAGCPWFMTLFGRDSLITAYQTLLFGPDLAIGTLRALARRQGTKFDDFRDEDPGKIFHEVRFGELTLFGITPHSPYYGTVDATPLFLILLSEVYRWTGDDGIVVELKENALKAMEWIDRYGDLDGDGYVEYKTRSPKGLDNQGWKDSGDAVRFANGKLAEPPIALCEVQGYVYDAKLRTAELAEEVWRDPAMAERLRREAAELKERFNRDFWINRRRGYFTMALDRDKRKVDSLTSNIGHLLWSGIVEEDKIETVVRQLMSEALYSGWGVRTMSIEDRGFNPISYHCGTVWPHDNSIIAAGLARSGYRAEANRIVGDSLQAFENFDYLMPEVFAGYSREQYTFPVRYPTSSCPQAWASGAPILFLTTILGLAPDRRRHRLALSPALPDMVNRVDLTGLKMLGKRYSISVAGSRVEVVEGSPEDAAAADRGG